MSSDLSISSRGQRALAAIVVTDVVGVSAPVSVDQENTLQLIHRDLAAMTRHCEDFEGQVLQSAGNGLLMYFVSAVQAVSCAIAIQKALAKSPENPHRPLHRLGIHMGDVFFDQSNVVGDSVTMAARLQTQARPGGICLSQLVYDLVKQRLSLNAEATGPLTLENVQEPVSAYHLTSLSSPRSRTADKLWSPSQSTASAQVLPEGTKVAGRYTIKRLLGQGGFGFSYLVEDTQRFGERCVLKELRPVQAQGKFLQKAIELFKREAKTLYSIDHPQIPRFMACFTQAKRLFIVQEYIDGVTYLKLLKHRKKQSKRFTEAEVVYWLVHMLKVLDYLHGLNIMHRDISPENVMYSRDRNLPILIDFGLVNNTISDVLSEQVVQEGDLKNSVTAVGKFGYSPPEQMYGKCTPASDLYALGVTALVLLTGQHPRNLMDDKTLDLQWQHHVKISPRLADVLTTMIQQQPQDRFQSALAVFEQLSPLLPADISKTLGQVQPRPAQPVQPQPTISRPRPDAAFISQCRDELIRHIGPIADVVIQETLDDNPHATPQEIVKILAGQITDADRATAFLSHICVPNEALAASQTMPEINTVIQNRRRKLSADFIDRCRHALAHAVGPMASMIVEDVLTDYPTVSAPAFVDRLAKEIPDGEKAKAFRQELRSELISGAQAPKN